MKTPRLETERLLLREILPDDAEDLFNEWMQDKDVSRYMWWEASDDIHEAKNFVDFEQENLQNDWWNRWMIVLKDTNELAGTCLVYFHDEEDHWDISYNLGKRFWGKGYMTEAMEAVIQYAVAEMHIQEIITSYAIGNHASGRVLQKLGFHVVKEIPYTCSGDEIITTGNCCRWKATNQFGR